MLKYAAGYLAAGLAMGLMDAIWLTQVGPGLYRPALDAVLTDSPRPGPAAVFYLVYVGGIVFLAVRPALQQAAKWWGALLNGAVLGLVAYATFDLTNQATLKVWPTFVSVADIAWGASLTAVAALAGFAAARRVGRR